MKRTKLQEVSSDHVWARNQIKGFRVLMNKSWPDKEINIDSHTTLRVEMALNELERTVKNSYLRYKRGVRN